MAFVWMNNSLIAQKFGHLNSGNLLSLLPEAQKADEQLVALQETLLKDYDTKLKDFRARGSKFMQDAQSGALSQVQIQEQQTKLEAEQQALAQEEQSIIAQVQKKRQELLEPILTRVDEVIQVIGKEGNYTMIFDTSKINAILFVEEADDLMPLVKERLGIK